MAIVIGDRFAYNGSLMEILKGQAFQLYLPPVELAAALDDVDLSDPVAFIKSLPETEGKAIDVDGVPNGSIMYQLDLGICGPVQYRAMFYVDPTPKVDRIALTCDLSEHEPACLRTMELTSGEFLELVKACQDFVATHEVSPVEKPVAQSKGPAKKAKAPAKA